MGAIKEPWDRAIHSNFHLSGHFVLLVFCVIFHIESRFSMKVVPRMEPRVDSFGSCVQKEKENRQGRFDCTSADGSHVSRLSGAPKATQNHAKKTSGFQDPFFSTKNKKIEET